jgi:hypothetical protein
MTTHTPQGRALAIAAGIASTAGGIAILMGPALTQPNEWTQYHGLAILTVGLTIGFGHLAHVAMAERRVLASLGFGMLFVLGTGIVTVNSVGRQAETADTQTLSTEAANAAIAAKHADLATARKRLDDANRAADAEMNGERCGPRCKDWRQRATEVQSHISVLEGDLAKLGPAKPVDAKASRVAQIVALFGGDPAATKAAMQLLEPFFWTLLFEIGSIVSFGYAARAGSSGPARLSASSAQAESDAASKAAPSGGQPAQPNRPERPDGSSPGPSGRKAEVLAAITTDVALGRTVESQRAMAGRFGIPTSTLSDWLREWEAAGLIPTRRTVGRCKVLEGA